VHSGPSLQPTGAASPPVLLANILGLRSVYRAAANTGAARKTKSEIRGARLWQAPALLECESRPSRQTPASSPAKGFLATKHRPCHRHRRSPAPLSRCDSSAHRQVKADFCLLFGGLQKVRRLAGRDPPVLHLRGKMQKEPDLKTELPPPSLYAQPNADHFYFLPGSCRSSLVSRPLFCTLCAFS